MEKMENIEKSLTPAAPPANNENKEKEDDIRIEIDSDLYKLTIYIEFTSLVIILEPEDNNPDKILQNSFNLIELKNFHKSFQSYETLEEMKENLLELLRDKKPTVQKNQNGVILNINYLRQNLSISLKKIDKDNDLSYNTLSEEMKKIIDSNELILGIDLGTTYSCASVMLDHRIVIIENSLGQRITPSYVCFLKSNEICVGELAKLQPSHEYKNIIYNSKRLLGRNINDKEIKEIVTDLPFEVRQDDELDQLKININFKDEGNKRFYPEQISALILKKIISDSEYYLQRLLNKHLNIRNAVITVPAYFNQKQREATYQAAKIINLNVKRMINEPTAASLAYGYKTIGNNNKLITVLDFGGGTLDLTLLQFVKNQNNVYCDIKFSYGNTHFGGEDFDYILMKKCLESVGQNKFDKKLQCNVRLKRACEIAKIKLSTNDSTNIILEEYSKDININFFLTKKDFETYCEPIFTKFENLLKEFLSSCGHKDIDIAEVILIGGTTLIPKVESIIQSVFKYSQIKKNINPKEAVAKGAAIQAAMLSKLSTVNNMSLLDVTNLSIGINIIGEKMSKIIKRSTPIPEEFSREYFTVADNQTEALIEIFEGEDKMTKNNLCLGKFIISDLPKMKKGEAKILVKILINDDSLLVVTAYDKQNENNFRQLTIKRPKGLSDKLIELMKETGDIEEIELEEYINIKDFILKLEEERLNANEANSQDINSKLINNLGEFILSIIKKMDKEKIVISYIKYYFLKAIKYFENNQEEKIIENFNKNLNMILEEIQFNSTDLIFEIIEIFVDNNRIYSKCLLQLLNNYYEKIAKKYFEVNSLLKKEPDNLDNALKILRELQERINFTEKFYDKPSGKDIKNELILVQNSIKELSLNITVKEIIIKNEIDPIDFNIIGEREKLENIYERYQKCKSNDIKDLIDLEKIIKSSNVLISEEEKKAQNFLQNFNRLEDDNHEKLLLIFNKYNIAGYYETDVLINLLNSEKRYEMIVKLCSIYQKYNNNLTQGAKKDAITQIQIYLNHLKKKCDNKNESLFSTY